MSAGYKLRDGYRVADEWEGRFACTLPDAELTWWDLDAGSPQELAEGMARCRECPISGQCLDEAVRKRETGVFGGRVVIVGKVTPLAKWLGRRKGQDMRPREVVGHRECPACGERFEVVAPKYAQKWCDACKIPETNRASVRRAIRSRRRRSEVAARTLEAEQPSA